MLANANVKLMRVQSVNDQAKISLAQIEFEAAEVALEVAVANVHLTKAEVGGDTAAIARVKAEIAQIKTIAETATTQRFELKRMKLETELGLAKEKTKQAQVAIAQSQSQSSAHNQTVMGRFIQEKEYVLDPEFNSCYEELQIGSISSDNFNNLWKEQAEESKWLVKANKKEERDPMLLPKDLASAGSSSAKALSTGPFERKN